MDIKIKSNALTTSDAVGWSKERSNEISNVMAEILSVSNIGANLTDMLQEALNQLKPTSVEEVAIISYVFGRAVETTNNLMRERLKGLPSIMSLLDEF